MKPPKTPQEIREKKKQIAEKLKARALARKTKKQFSRSKLVEEADRIFSIYIRGRDAWKPCCTCWAIWTENAQCWHFMSRRHYQTRWVHHNAHWQCYRCNMLLSWEQYKHWKFIDDTYGNTTIWLSMSEYLHEQAMRTDKIPDDEILTTIQTFYRKCLHFGIDYKPKKQFLN